MLTMRMCGMHLSRSWALSFARRGMGGCLWKWIKTALTRKHCRICAVVNLVMGVVPTYSFVYYVPLYTRYQHFISHDVHALLRQYLPISHCGARLWTSCSFTYVPGLRVPTFHLS